MRVRTVRDLRRPLCKFGPLDNDAKGSPISGWHHQPGHTSGKWIFPQPLMSPGWFWGKPASREHPRDEAFGEPAGGALHGWCRRSRDGSGTGRRRRKLWWMKRDVLWRHVLFFRYVLMIEFPFSGNPELLETHSQLRCPGERRTIPSTGAGTA